MAATVFNIAKGRVAELYNRVKTADPADSALVLVALQASGLESHATLRDYETLAAILAAANNEATNAGYSRKVLVAADLAALPVDHANDRRDLDIPDQTFIGVQAAGGAWGALVLCYDPDITGGDDTTLLPLAVYDFAVTPDGNPIVAVVNAAGFHRAA